MRRAGHIWVMMMIAMGGCGEEAPPATRMDASVADGAEGDGGSEGEDLMVADMEIPEQQCEPQPTDYQPRENGSADDPWQPCISDDNAYHQVEASISSIARVAAAEEILHLLESSPTSQDFLNARVVYTQEEGLESRVVRREDEHYPKVLDPVTGEELSCSDEGVAELDPERCVGPGLLGPLLNGAFEAGINGEESLANGARIEAAILWFFYVSVYKEATTCTTTAKDCDSSWAYYSGGEAREGGLGLSRYVRELDQETHDRVWDGLLALRCWRDLDPDDIATNLDLRDQALAQVDQALLRGLAQIVVDRLVELTALDGEAREAAWEFAQILGLVLLREAEQRDPSRAAAMEEQLNQDSPDDGDMEPLILDLAEVFPCP